MTIFIPLLIALIGSAILAIRREPILSWAGLAVVTSVLTLFTTGFGFLFFLFALITILLGLCVWDQFRERFIARPAFKLIRKVIPPVSETEKEALEGGTIGWDAELFSGTPDYDNLRAISPIRLTEEERAFLDGPTETLCKMADDWQVRAEEREIPDEIWDYIKDNGFLGMLISKEHGGLGFSAQAQSLILGKIASRSPDVSVIVMVPNSLGPGELIEKYGTEQQIEHYLPRLANGKEIPCFALTGPTSGSDAAAMRDIGIVTKGQFEGKETIGVRLSWEKRYITLGPKATLLGMAFRLFDPDKLLSDEEDRGITLALIPTNHQGVDIGDRHLPCGCAFPNGPNSGNDVFIPLEWIIGGEERVGEGWRMLMSCLAAGRAISLPSSSTAAAKSMLRFTTAYGRIRSQFGIPISKMEGIEERLTEMIEAAYILEAARAVTASMVQGGEKPAVISALLKYQSTEWARRSVNNALDVHGGRGICDGPANYVQAAYQSIPVGITVEGANILTRTLITFAQGALRSHPYLYKEVAAAQMDDDEEAFKTFEPLLYDHIKFSLSNIFASFVHNVSLGTFAHSPSHAGNATKWYRALSRASRNFALMSDLTVALLGGALKMRQRISGRMADALSELYFLSAILKRYEDDGQASSDLIFVEYTARNALYRYYQALDRVIQNYPIPIVGFILRFIVFPFGNHHKQPKDRLGKAMVKKVMSETHVRDALTREMYINHDEDDPTGVLEVTLKEVIELEPVTKKIETAIKEGRLKRYHGLDWLKEANEKNIISDNEMMRLRRLEALVSKVIAVDQFDPKNVSGVKNSTAIPMDAAE